MVNATVDNKPVSILLDGGQSTTVPSNETWRVSIHMANASDSQMTIDGIGKFKARVADGSGQGNYLDVTLTGGQTVAEIKGKTSSGIFITGFVVNS
jgi:hypothetical protein